MKHIFDIVQKNDTLANNVMRIVTLFETEDMFDVDFFSNATLLMLINERSFNLWKGRGHCIDLEDYLSIIDYNSFKFKAIDEEESFILLIELIYNFWTLANNLVKKKIVKPFGNFYLLKTIMDDCLAQINHTIFINKKEERVYVVENKAEVTAVTETIDSKLILPIIKYNHHTLKGNLEEKRNILRLLGTDLEHKRKTLNGLNKSLTSTIFFILNNFNIRHDNVTSGSVNFYEPVSGFSNSKFESWYDDLYQLILYANILIDNQPRIKRATEFMKNEGTSNG